MKTIRITANREDLEEVEIGDFEGYYFKDADTKNMVLSDEEYTLLFIGDFSREEFLGLAENLHVIE